MCVERVGAECLACGVSDGFSLEGGVRVVAGDRGVGVVCSAPTLSHFSHFRNDCCSLLRMGDTGSEGIASAFARCVGDELGESGAGVGVGVAIVGDLESF
ncbi:MAG: hypothetical protein RIS92_869 [Verrucomicrobiota bacterium]